MEETISLKELFETLRKRLALILVLAFTAATISGVISYFFITPIYQVSTQLLVARQEAGQNYNTNEVQTNIQLINTYSGIITSPAILDIVADELGDGYTYESLKSKVTVQNSNESQILSIAVQDENPVEAVLIANKVAEIFKREIPNIIYVDNVSILAPAEINGSISPVEPKPALNIAIALVVGLMAGVGLAFLLEYLDNTIKTEQDVDQLLGIPVLGVVTTFNTEEHLAQARSKKRSKRGEK